MSFNPVCRPIQAAEDPIRTALQPLVDDPQKLISHFNLAWMAWNGRAEQVLNVEILRVHYKPFSRARMVMSVELRPLEQAGIAQKALLYLQFYPDLDTAQQRQVSYRQKVALPSLGPPSFVLNEQSAIGYTLPNGPRLRRLAMLISPASFLRFLVKKELTAYAQDDGYKNLEILRYVPRKRALLYLRPKDPQLRPAYLKHFSPDDYPIARTLHKKIERISKKGNFRFNLPRVLAQGGLRRIIMLEELPGTRFTNLFQNPPAAACWQVGDALSSLHHSKAKSKVVWTPLKEWTWLSYACEEMALAVPKLKPRFSRIRHLLASQLVEVENYKRRPIHANLFGDQILIDKKDVGIVDWDDLSKGDPCFDLGRLIAHYLYVVHCVNDRPLQDDGFIRNLLDGYNAKAKRNADIKRLTWHIACALPMRAKISALRMLPPGWVGQIDRACQLAEHVLDHGIPCINDDGS
ncbi:MAG: phosphotransferase [Planctomycetes bacterium]|nr:phosphotransferase [Planctomycetota bacterium]